MDKRKTDQYGIPLDNEDFLHQKNVASSMDCTGLMPSNPCTEDEAESYGALYDVAQTKAGKPITDFSNCDAPKGKASNS